MIIISSALGLLSFLAILAPGLWLTKKYTPLSRLPLTSSLMFSGLVAYGVFLISYAVPVLGTWVARLYVLSGLVFLALFFLRKIKLRNYKHILSILALIISASLFYNSFLLGCTTEIDHRTNNEFEYKCLTSRLPVDNILPHYFANNVRNDEQTKKYSSWNLHDRPPLQTGYVLLTQSPELETPFNIYTYQTVATLLQLSWLFSLIEILPLLGLSKRQSWFAASLFGLGGFTLVNTIFVWPKFLASSFALGAIAVLFSKKFRKKVHPAWAMPFAGLAMLSHGGIIFSVPAVALIYLYRKGVPPLKDILIALGILLVIMLPWTALKSALTPHGDRLIKWHLGGFTGIDERGTAETIFDAYTETSPSELASNKVKNLRSLVQTPGRSLINDGDNVTEKFRSLRSNSFFSLVPALGIANVGLGYLAYNSIKRRRDKSSADLKLIAGIGFGGLVFWLLTMFLPASTILHQGSYLTPLLIFVLGAVGIEKMTKNNMVLFGVLALQAFILYMGWFYSYSANSITSFNSIILLSFVALVACVVLLRRIYR